MEVSKTRKDMVGNKVPDWGGILYKIFCLINFKCIVQSCKIQKVKPSRLIIIHNNTFSYVMCTVSSYEIKEHRVNSLLILLSKYSEMAAYVSREIPSSLVFRTLPFKDMSLCNHWFSFFWVFWIIGVKFQEDLAFWFLVIEMPRYLTSSLTVMLRIERASQSLTANSSHLSTFRHRPSQASAHWWSA